MNNQVGPDNSIFFTDFGQFPNPTVVEGVRILISSLLAVGLKEDEVRTIACENFRRVLD